MKPATKAAPSKSVQIEKHMPQPIEEVPAYLKPRGAPRGGEEVEGRDVTTPRLAICQSMTPHRKKTSDKYIEGLAEGEYYCTVGGTRYGSSVLIIPIFFFKSQIKFKPFDEGGGIVCQAVDGKMGVGDPGGVCMKCQFGPILGWRDGKNGERQPPECTELKNYAVIVIPRDRMPSLQDAMVLSFKTTALGKSKEWNAELRARNRDWWSTIYELTTAEKSNDQDQSWFTPVVSVYRGPKVPASNPSEKLPSAVVNEDIMRIGESVYNQMIDMRRAGKLVVDVEEFAPESDEPGGSDESNA